MQTAVYNVANSRRRSRPPVSRHRAIRLTRYVSLVHQTMTRHPQSQTVIAAGQAGRCAQRETLISRQLF